MHLHRTGFLFALVILSGCTQRESVNTETRHHPYYRDRQTYEDYFQNTTVTEQSLTEEAIGGIVPHHLFVGHEIAKYYHALRTLTPSVVVVIGPNHFGIGKQSVQSTLTGYNTPYGPLDVDTRTIEALHERGLVSIEDDTFDAEHSISTQVAFIKRAFPRATILPIVLKVNVSEEKVLALAKALAEGLPKDALVLGSVDFSHYLPAEVAAFHDRYSRAVLEQFAGEHVANLEVDSPPSLLAVMAYLDARGARWLVYDRHTNSADFTGTLVPKETTSHFFLGFAKGEAPKSPFASLLFLGDTIVDRGIAQLLQKGIDPLARLRGAENRFFRGVTVSALNLEGPVTASGATDDQKPVSFGFDPELTTPLLKDMEIDVAVIANNHIDDAGQKGTSDTLTFLESNDIAAAGSPDHPCAEHPVLNGTMAICAFADLSGVLDVDRAVKILEDQREHADFLVVSMHWGTEYARTASERQRLIARAFVDTGADAIIGHGPHVVQEMERIDGKPVFYSIGNFLFDQPDKRLSDGMAVGLVFENGTIDVAMFPLKTTGGSPQLREMSGTQP